MQVQSVGNAVALDVLEQGFLEDIVVVTVVQGAGAGQEIQVLVAFLVVHELALGPLEEIGEGARVALNFGFDFVENFHGFLG